MLHRDLYYLSERLALDLAHQADAKKRTRLRAGATLSIPGVPVSPAVSVAPAVTEANRHALADRALHCAADEAGTFECPGRYLHVERCSFSLWVFSFKGLRSRQPIALTFCEDSSGSLGIFIGRAANVFGYSSERPIDGWIPSDPGGLHYLARFAGESDFDDRTAALFNPSGREQEALLFGEEPPDLVADGASIAASITRSPDRTGTADVLAKVHEYSDDVDIVMPTRGYRTIAPRAIVGAPIFIREPTPTALPGIDT